MLHFKTQSTRDKQLRFGIVKRVVIFEQPFDTTFGDNFFFLSFH